MKSLHAAVAKPRDLQRGVAVVEFALIVPIFFLLLFAAMELGRLLYLWNTVQEVTRHAARQAVVTDFTDTAAIDAIKRSAVFRTDDGNLPASSEITSDRVRIRWLNPSGNEVTNLPDSPADNVAACLDAKRSAQCIRFVEVCVSTGTTCEAEYSVPFVPMIPQFSYLGVLKIPMSTVRMPAESLELPSPPT